MYVKIIASCKGGTFFETQCILFSQKQCMFLKLLSNSLDLHYSCDTELAMIDEESDYGIIFVNKFLGPLTLKGPMKDGCKIL